MIRLLANPLPPHPVSKLSLFLCIAGRAYCRERGWAWSQIIRPRESPALYKPFSNLCFPLRFLSSRILYWLNIAGSHLQKSMKTRKQEVTAKRRCLSWLTNSALVYEPKCGGRCGGRLSQWVQLYTWSPNKLWRSNCILTYARKDCLW